MSSSQFQQKLLDLSSLTSKLLRKNFGRGPTSCHAYANYHFLVFYIRGFLSPLEAVLLENGDSDNVEISRAIVMKNILAQLKGILEIEFEKDVKNFYNDWNYPQNTGMITVEFEETINPDEPPNEPTQHNQLLIDEVQRISYLVQKVPERTESFQISPKVYLVKRYGILVPIEKALIENGFHQTLMVTKDTLEKSYFHKNGRFEDIFHQPVADIFVDWDFHKDNSVLCFVLN